MIVDLHFGGDDLQRLRQDGSKSDFPGGPQLM